MDERLERIPFFFGVWCMVFGCAIRMSTEKESGEGLTGRLEDSTGDGTSSNRVQGVMVATSLANDTVDSVVHQSYYERKSKQQAEKGGISTLDSKNPVPVSFSLP